MDSFLPGPRKPIWFALRKACLVSLGLAVPAGGSLADTVSQWDCRAGPEGEWQCRERRVKQPYARPSRQPESRPSTPEEPRITVAPNLDWVPIEQLSESEKAGVRPNCCGAYIEPERDYVDSGKEPDNAPLRVSADTTEAQGDVATLRGDVQVSQGYRQVRSNRAVVDRAQRTVDLEGNITFREPGVLMTGENAAVNFDTGQLEVDDVEFVLHDAGVRGKAGQLERPDEKRIYVHDATYTSCQPTDNTWSLRASRVDIDTADSMATARHVRLNVRDWPVLYVPWIRYPISDNRATGLLFPSVMTGNDNGLDYAQPIYLNLAPQYDATFTPRYIQERGAMAELELRHLSRWTETTVSGGYLWDDDGGSGRDPEYVGRDRWTLNIDHRGGMGHNWNTLIDYTDVSDNDYFRDVDSASLQVSSTSHLNQQLRVGYNTDHWQLSAQGQEYETIIDNGLEQYKQLPRVDANGRYRFGASDLVLSMRQHYVAFDHSEDDVTGSGTVLTTDTENTTVTGSRVRADYSLAWDKEWLWGFFRPEVTGKYMTYDLDNPLMGREDDSPHAFIPVGSLDTGLFFERETNLLPGHIQTLEPRLYYLYSEYEDQSAIPNFDTSELTFSYQQLFRDDRFSGGDRVGDTEQVTLGVTSRLIDADSGREKLRFSIGQIHYLRDRHVSLGPLGTEDLNRDSSDIALELSARFLSHWRLQSDLLTDDNEGRIDKGNVSLRYNDGDNSIFNLSYRYTRRRNPQNVDNRFALRSIDQADLSFALPVTDSWRVLGRYNYDLRTNEELEAFAGLEYASCCWSASVVARRWIDRDDRFTIGSGELDHNNGIFFQIQFRGLAGTGDRVDNILSEGIYGYQPSEN